MQKDLFDQDRKTVSDPVAEVRLKGCCQTDTQTLSDKERERRDCADSDFSCSVSSELQHLTENFKICNSKTKKLER